MFVLDHVFSAIHNDSSRSKLLMSHNYDSNYCKKLFSGYISHLSHCYDSFKWCMENGHLENCFSIFLRGRSYQIANKFFSLSFKFNLLQNDMHIVYFAPLEIEISQMF